jgi:hypothetical protein
VEALVKTTDEHLLELIKRLQADPSIRVSLKDLVEELRTKIEFERNKNDN